jgi:hypothetical protein
LFSFEEKYVARMWTPTIVKHVEISSGDKKSSGTSHLDISSAMAFSSWGTHAMIILILNSRQKRKSSLAKNVQREYITSTINDT